MLTEAGRRFREQRIAHWDRLAEAPPRLRLLGSGYRSRLEAIYRFHVPAGQRVLEMGSGTGDLLAAVRPTRGVGVDVSPRQVSVARAAHPDLAFAVADAAEYESGEEFDVVILSDLVDDLWDVQAVLENVRRLCSPHTRVVVNSYNRLWQFPLRMARWLRIAKPVLPQNWLTASDTANLLDLTGFEVLRIQREIMFPVRIPLVAGFFNRFLVKWWPFSRLALTHVLVARPRPEPAPDDGGPPAVSIVVPARNEEGHIDEIVRRIPDALADAEILFVEGGSSDDTVGAIEAAIGRYPDRSLRLLRQTGTGKGDAVRLGFAEAGGDVLVILDADMTVAPEDVPRFVDALVAGAGDFINGVRLVYPMDRKAMRFLNLLGNKFFGAVFTWVLQQRIKDTLCGTKVLRRSDYERIAANRAYFGNFDPFGDFDLLFGASRLNLKIVDLPVRYHERTYGATNISRWRHGLLLLRMAAFAARRLRFI